MPIGEWGQFKTHLVARFSGERPVDVTVIGDNSNSTHEFVPDQPDATHAQGGGIRPAPLSALGSSSFLPSPPVSPHRPNSQKRLGKLKQGAVRVVTVNIGGAEGIIPQLCQIPADIILIQEHKLTAGSIPVLPKPATRRDGTAFGPQPRFLSLNMP